jgi:hypothetical protein
MIGVLPHAPNSGSQKKLNAAQENLNIRDYLSKIRCVDSRYVGKKYIQAFQQQYLVPQKFSNEIGSRAGAFT